MSLYEKLIAKEAVLAVVGLGLWECLLRWHLQRRA